MEENCDIDIDIETLFNVEYVKQYNISPVGLFFSTNISKIIKSNRIYHSMHKYKHRRNVSIVIPLDIYIPVRGSGTRHRSGAE